MRVIARNFAAWMLLAFVLCACSTMGAADTFSKRVSGGRALSGAIDDTATALMKAKKISVADAKNVQQTTGAALAGLDIAEDIGRLDQAAGQNRLTQILAILTATQAYLATKGAPQ